MKKIGFIGLGTMGTPMATNLLKAGYELCVYNRTAEKTKPLADLGAKVAASPAAVAKQCEVVITMLAADPAVKEVVLGRAGILDGASAGLIVIDSSTVSPATSKQIAAELAKANIEMLDAPVTGSKPQAIEAKLTFMVGGKKEIYEKCIPLFKAMGKANYHMGANGTGSYTKVSNNTISAITLVAFAEGVVMATKAGIDPRLFVEVISLGGARSGQIENRGPKVLSRDFRPNFATALMYKDLGLAGEIAKELNIPTPALAIAREMLNMAIAKGYGQDDVCSVVKCYEEWAGVEVNGGAGR
jgi:3-hydroxyisobutyrate dehydrogenase-like beta-hydroxyacid dehydrogenase